jgi:hypothetical protein
LIKNEFFCCHGWAGVLIWRMDWKIYGYEKRFNGWRRRFEFFIKKSLQFPAGRVVICAAGNVLDRLPLGRYIGSSRPGRLSV